MWLAFSREFDRTRLVLERERRRAGRVLAKDLVCGVYVARDHRGRRGAVV